MKKYLLSIVAVFAAAGLYAQQHVVERTFLSTDKACYVSGDNIWLSAFCLDASGGCAYSNFSSIAYVELCSESGVVATAKVALMDGRGAGSLLIPRSLPSGNYRLLAYTRQNVNEDGYDYFENAKTISVFNTFTSERSQAAVRIVADADYGRSEPVEGSGTIRLSIGARNGRQAKISLGSGLAKAASLSVSVYHEDALAAPAGTGVSDFLTSVGKVGSPSFSKRVIPDFEGEVLTGRCVGSDAEKYKGCYAVISSPGDLSGIYYSLIGEDGSVRFCTNNYYGNSVLVSQIDDIDPVGDAYIEFDSPFVDNKADGIEPLQLCPSLRESLELRSAAMQIERLFTSDTLFNSLPKRPNLLLRAQEPVSYILKDYTRFPVMNEVLVEFVKGARFRTENRKHVLAVTLTDAQRPGMAVNSSSLALIDGTPVLDQEKIYDYDPLLVERIDIYPSTFLLGPRSVSGVVNFITYKRNMPTLTFDPSVRVTDFQGACLPQAYTCRNISENSNYPDYRNTLYWHPIVNLGAGETFEFDCQLPSYEGRFRVVVEGMTEDGQPVCETVTF